MSDLISRQAVIDLLKGNIEWMYKDCNVYSKLPEWKQKIIDINQNIIGQINKSIKPVNPQPKTGHWQVVSDGYGDNAYICECSECKDTVWVYKNADRKWNYCPNCGAKMVEPQESEDKK